MFLHLTGKGCIMKKLIFLLTLITIPVFADWLDDVVKMVEKENCFNYRKANNIITTYINQDKERIRELEDHNQKEADTGLLEKVKDFTVDNAQLLAARTSLKYHEGVAEFFKKLSLDAEKRKTFHSQCLEFSKLTCKLSKAEVAYSRAKKNRDKARLLAHVGAAKAQVEAKRVYLKAIKF